MSTFEFELNTRKPQSEIMQVTTRVGDNDTTMRVTILDGDEPYDFAGKYLEFAMVRTDGKWVHLKECVTQIEDNIWECTLPPEAVATSGIVTLAYFVVRDEGDDTFRDSTQRVQIIIDNSATGNADIGPYSDQLDALIRQAMMLLDAWETQLKAQKYEFDHAMDVWADRFSKAVKAWDAQFQQSQTERTQAYEQAEQSRDDRFAAAEATREEKSDAATNRANAAAEKIEKALMGDLNDLFGDWIDSQKDTEGGLVSYDAMVRGDYVSVDDVTIQKSEEGQLSVKDGGISSTQLAVDSVVTDKIMDATVTTPKLADGAVTAGKIADGAVTADKLEDYAISGDMAKVLGVPEYFFDSRYPEIAEGYTATVVDNLHAPSEEIGLDIDALYSFKWQIDEHTLILVWLSGGTFAWSNETNRTGDPIMRFEAGKDIYVTAMFVHDSGVHRRFTRKIDHLTSAAFVIAGVEVYINGDDSLDIFFQHGEGEGSDQLPGTWIPKQYFEKSTVCRIKFDTTTCVFGAVDRIEATNNGSDPEKNTYYDGVTFVPDVFLEGDPAYKRDATARIVIHTTFKDSRYYYYSKFSCKQIDRSSFVMTDDECIFKCEETDYPPIAGIIELPNGKIEALGRSYAPSSVYHVYAIVYDPKARKAEVFDTNYDRANSNASRYHRTIFLSNQESNIPNTFAVSPELFYDGRNVRLNFNAGLITRPANSYEQVAARSFYEISEILDVSDTYTCDVNDFYMPDVQPASIETKDALPRIHRIYDSATYLGMYKGLAIIGLAADNHSYTVREVNVVYALNLDSGVVKLIDLASPMVQCRFRQNQSYIGWYATKPVARFSRSPMHTFPNNVIVDITLTKDGSNKLSYLTIQAPKHLLKEEQ